MNIASARTLEHLLKTSFLVELLIKNKINSIAEVRWDNYRDIAEQFNSLISSYFDSEAF